MKKIQKLILSVYFHLRVGVGVVGILFPFLLAVGGAIYSVPLAGSMSAYYHATPACPGTGTSSSLTETFSPCLPPGQGPMRNWFVGILFFIGAAMYFIKGFSTIEDWALNIAGVMAPCVALFPMPWPSGSAGSPTHYICAIAFFLCISFTCIFCADTSLKYMPPIPNRQRIITIYKTIYRVLAAVMILAPLCVWLFTRNSEHGTFWLEAAGIAAFGCYWLVKTTELKKSDLERRILLENLSLN